MAERKRKINETYSPTAIVEMANDLGFPLSKNDLINKYGNEQVEWPNKEVVTLKDILEDVDADCFNSPSELEDLLNK